MMNGKRGDCIIRSFRLLDLFLFILEHMSMVTAALVSTYVQVSNSSELDLGLQ